MIKRPSLKETFYFDWVSLIISLHFRQQFSDFNLYISSPGDFVTVGHVSDIYDIFDIFCLFCDILTYSLSEGAECLESHLQVIRNPWTNFVKNVRQMWKSAPCWWFCENFWFTASWKDCFGSPGGLDIKSLNCIQWNFRKLENIAPCCEHFLLPPFRKGQNFWEFRCWEKKSLDCVLCKLRQLSVKKSFVKCWQFVEKFWKA